MEIVYLYLYFLDIFCCEDNLHYLQYIPEDEIGETEDIMYICDSNSFK